MKQIICWFIGHLFWSKDLMDIRKDHAICTRCNQLADCSGPWG